jgi:hypothetical protein
VTFDYERPVRRKRHPIRNTIIVLVIIGALGTSGYLVADSLARSFATTFVQAGVAQQLGVPTDQVHVNLGKGSVLLQVVQKHIKRLHVTVDAFTSGTLAGSAVFDAVQVPLNTKDPAGSIDITVTVAASGLLGLVESKSGQSQATVSMAGGDIRVSTKEKVLGATIPVSIDFAPSGSGVTLVLTPKNIVVGSKSYTPASLKASKYGPFVSGLLATRHECLAGGLPTGMQLGSIAVTGGQLVIEASGANLPLGSLSTKGICPAS